MSEKEIKDLKSLYEKGLISKEAYEEAVSKLENKDSATEIHQLKKELEDLKKKRKELKENKISNEDSQTTKNSDNSLSNSSTLKNLLVKNQTIIGIAFLFRNLINNNELISMRNTGYSIFDIFLPIGISVFLLGLFFYF